MKPRTKLPNLCFEIVADYEGMSRTACALIVAGLKKKPDLILCASAGGTPTRTYELLVKRSVQNPLLCKRMRVLQIDEWGGIPSTHPASCRSDLRHKLVEPLGIGKTNFVSFSSDAPDPEAEVRRVSNWLAVHGPIDLCILGLGTNGHTAMNEPAPALIPGAHVTKLARSSLRHSMLRALKPKPRYGLSVGMADILCSRQALMLVSGEAKKAAMSRFLDGKVSTAFPASLLWLHPNAVVICDRQAIA
jgi:galactosamine-6-phosphate isomerase